MNRFFHPAPFRLDAALGAVRIVLGLLLVYHGQEVFQPELMRSYLDWDPFKGPNGSLLVYAGKSAELIAGLSLALGLGTRLGALLCAGTLAYVTFFVGKGQFWYGDQHPFMFVLFGLLYAMTGPGAWSVDGLLFGRKKEAQP
jgi:putative oxidoreductase